MFENAVSTEREFFTDGGILFDAPKLTLGQYRGHP